MERELIFEILNGYYKPDKPFLYGGLPVDNEFEEGKRCGKLYSEVYDAQCRLAQKLGMEEDKDVERIMNNMNEITRILCYKMYEYGMHNNLEERIQGLI